MKRTEARWRLKRSGLGPVALAALIVVATARENVGAESPPTCKLPATGQTISYVKGDDGDVRAGGALSYTDNGDGTITDNNTGLMWEKKSTLEGLGLPDAANLHGGDNCYPWQGFCSGNGAECGTDADCGSGQTCDADDCQTAFPNGLTVFKWVAALNAGGGFAGHNDWRIPNIKELDSIVNYGTANPSVSPPFNGEWCTPPWANPGASNSDPTCIRFRDVYWSATTSSFLSAIAWSIGFGNGIVNGGNAKPAGLLGALFVIGQPPNGNYVRAVRGESCGFPATGQDRTMVQHEDGNPAFGATLSYTDNGDGTITDNVTGLTWEKKVARDEVANPANLHDADNVYFWRGSCSGAIIESVLFELSGSAGECGTDADCGSGQTCIAVDGQGSGMTIFQWVAALNRENSVGFAGHNDWRIPNAKELQSIVNYGTVSPAVSQAFNGSSCGVACTDLIKPECSCTVSASYWSATTESNGATEINGPAGSWGVDFDQGAVSGFGFDKATGLGVANNSDFGARGGYVRAVRGGL